MSKKAPPPPKRRKRLGADLEAQGWIRISVASERYGAAPTTILDWLRANRIASRRAGPKIWLVLEADVERVVSGS